MRLDYVVRRIVLFVVVIWAAATLNFFLPRISRQDPIRSAAACSRRPPAATCQTGMEEMVEDYSERFGLDDPLWQQYSAYLGDVARLDFGYSIANYPATVIGIMGDAIPWTIGLLLTTTHPRLRHRHPAGRAAGLAPVARLHPVPLSAAADPLRDPLLPARAWSCSTVFAFRLHWFPLFGGYTPGTFPALNLELRARRAQALDPARLFDPARLDGLLGAGDARHDGHGRGRGLHDLRRGGRSQGQDALLHLRPAQRPAAADDGPGALARPAPLRRPPGRGHLLLSRDRRRCSTTPIRQFDYFVIQGIIFTIVLAVTLATLILDLIYPLLDPRITYQRG